MTSSPSKPRGLSQIRTLQDVVDWDLCTGCGACYAQCTHNAIQLVNIPAVGIRPQFEAGGCAGCTECLSICPGYQIDAELETGLPAPLTQFDREFGPALEIWEGYACDAEIRYKGSSGGVLSALALYCLEQESMEFVLHSGVSEAEPWTNTPVLSRNRAELLAHAGSRYAPASPCAGLGSIEQSDRPCVFIGKPCDAAAVAMLRRERPELDRRLGLVLTFCCAGTPSTQGTVDVLKRLEVDPASVTSLRYRGEGWPGLFRVLSDGGSRTDTLTYHESWSQLTGYRPLRCNLCPDGLGRIADISCGDAWHRVAEAGDPGRSLILVRTKRGQELLAHARAAGYVHLTPLCPEAVLVAQSSLLQRRRELFGRLLALRLLGIPVPKFANFSLLASWLKLPLGRKIRTVSGTLRRAVVRGWRRRRVIA